MGTLLFILIISGFYKPFYQPPAVQAAVISEQIPEGTRITFGNPTRLRIPTLGMDRDLLTGEYNPDDQSWTLSPRGVHFATASAPANDYGGSTFIYGHNNTHVFGPLSGLRSGDIAEILTDNNLIFTYTFTQRDTLKPENTSPLTYQGDPRLTLQTCSGNWHQNRELFYFELTHVEYIDPEKSDSFKAAKAARYSMGDTAAMTILKEMSSVQ